MAEATRTFRAHPASLKQVRDFVRDEATTSGLEPIADDIVAAASEAAANAILHARGTHIEVGWVRLGDAAEIEVRDQGVFKRRVKMPLAEGGRGIFMMMSLMDEVSIREGRPDRPGTVVRLRKNLEQALSA